MSEKESERVKLFRPNKTFHRIWLFQLQWLYYSYIQTLEISGSNESLLDRSYSRVTPDIF